MFFGVSTLKHQFIPSLVGGNYSISWRVRGYCEKYGEYRHFVLSRFRSKRHKKA